MLVRLIQAFVAASVVLGLYHLANVLDGALFPVFTNVQLVSAEPGPRPLSTKLHMTFYKERDCTYLDSEFFVGTPEAGLKVTSEWLEPPAILGADTEGHSFRILNMPPEALRNNSYAIAYHDCYNGWLWRTATVFWNTSRQN